MIINNEVKWGKLSDFSTEDRLMQRQLVVKPLVDAFFAYLKQNEPKIPKNGKIREAFTYALNQESAAKAHRPRHLSA